MNELIFCPFCGGKIQIKETHLNNISEKLKLLCGCGFTFEYTGKKGSFEKAWNKSVNNEWISVKDKLPDKGRDYLCRCCIGDNIEFPFFMVLRYILIDENPHFQHECNDGLRVTHWMPIPEFTEGE